MFAEMSAGVPHVETWLKLEGGPSPLFSAVKPAALGSIFASCIKLKQEFHWKEDGINVLRIFQKAPTR